MSRALRNAVSPDVIGAAMTPSMARMPPNVPSHDLEMLSTRIAGDDEPMNCCRPSYPPVNVIAAAAHIKATMPSATIAP